MESRLHVIGLLCNVKLFLISKDQELVESRFKDIILTVFPNIRIWPTGEKLFSQQLLRNIYMIGTEATSKTAFPEDHLKEIEDTKEE